MAPDSADLSAYLDGELSETERRAVEARLAGDPEYAREFSRLERTRTMVALAIEQPSFHVHLMRRIENGTRRSQAKALRRQRVALALAACLVMAIAFVLYQFMGSGPVGDNPPPGLGKFAAVPVTSDTTVSENAPPAAPATEQPAPTETTASAQTFEAVQLPISLNGTMTGPTPTAVLTVEGDGGPKTGTYAPGDTIIEGVTLVSVERGKVVLDNQGQQVELTMAATPPGPPVDLNGAWMLSILEDGKPHSEPTEVVIRQDGPNLTGTYDEDAIQATLTGDVMRAKVTPETGDPFDVTGVFNEQWTECTGQLPPEAFGESERAPGEVTFRLTRVPPEEAALKRLREERLKEVEAMASILKEYDSAHEGAYPARLEDLVPDYAADLDAFADTDVRTVHYHCSPKAKPDGFPKYEDTDSLLSDPERLVQWERQLKEAGLDAVFRSASPLLVVDYTKPAMRFRMATKWGSVWEEPAGPVADNDPDGLALARAACQNNLKYLALTIKIFENEHDNYTPAGWLSCYPEYLTDPSILTSPKDAPGTDSYIYLYPATNEEDLIRELHADLLADGNPAGRAKAESEVPLVMNRTDFPGPTPGRNVLFVDGHVAYYATKSGELDKILALAQRLGK